MTEWLEYTLSRKPGKSALDRAYMEALRDDMEFGDAEWRFRQHMTGEHGPPGGDSLGVCRGPTRGVCDSANRDFEIVTGGEP